MMSTFAESAAASRQRYLLDAAGAAPIALQVQRTLQPRTDAPDVLYVHGATFGADLSLFFALDGASWADALTRAGWNAWGLDFVGFGASARYPADLARPAGSIEEAARYAGEQAANVQALVLFAPIVARAPTAPAPAARPQLPSHHLLSAWAQYRRFVEDVPRGQPQVLAEAHMQAWAQAYLASDPDSNTRLPPAVLTPCGPLADIAALWSGVALYDPARVQAPTLLVRGEWDSLCTDADAHRLLAALGTPVRRDVKIPRATHLMHLEQQRLALHQAVNRFLDDLRS